MYEKKGTISALGKKKLRKRGIKIDKQREKQARWFQEKGRGALYSFLSRVFKDEIRREEIFTFFQGESFFSLKSAVFHLPHQKAPLLWDRIIQVQESIEKGGIKEEAERESLDLRKEFAYLFLTPQGVYPFESIYRGKKKLLMDKPWEEVRDFYRRLGIEKDKTQMHPEDHIAVELGFMASFSYLSSDLWAAEAEVEVEEEEKEFLLQVQHDFLEEHLIKWAPAFCRDLIDKTRHPFYAATAALADLFLKVDLDMLKGFLTTFVLKG